MMQKSHQTYVNRLKELLAEDLPGINSHMKMVPSIRQREIEKQKWNMNAKKAAVLICLYPGENGSICFPLIRRNEYDGVHSGQISLPGGKFEEHDENLIQTATREAEEETNIRASQLEILGTITPVYIPPSNFIVQPVIAWASEKPEFIPEQSEVAEIITVSLTDLTSENARQLKNIPHREYSAIDVPCFYIHRNIIWGATAMILSEVVEILGSLTQLRSHE
ncbi:MAG: CoA pyrophosphatase [Bacteroidales bacterium]|nr:CoA pyrophosphatase [Bacteroidales bacterium]